MDSEVVIALVVGVLQGIFEWLPVSSEGNVTVVLTALGSDPTAAVQYSLFLHIGTALAATVYYRDTLAEVGWTLSDLRPDDPFRDETATLSFLVLATLASGIVGIAAYVAIEGLVSELTGGAAVALIGVLLVATGILQLVAGTGAQVFQPGQAAQTQASAQPTDAGQVTTRSQTDAAQAARPADPTEAAAKAAADGSSYPRGSFLDIRV